MKFKKMRAFTLIELLIVVAIIGILAAIAVPNFLNARMRATIAKMQTDLRALGDALHMYRIDNKCYFEQMGSNPAREMQRLTTPIVYIAAIPHDPFRSRLLNPKYQSTTENYDYSSYPISYSVPKCKKDWLLHGIGPDTDEDTSVDGLDPSGATAQRKLLFMRLLYQPSNGLVSSGDVIHNSWSGLSF